MARTELSVETIDRSGLDPTETLIPADGIKFLNDGTVLIMVTNTGVAENDVTIQTPNNVDGDLTVADRVVAVAASAVMFIGPFPTNHYNQAGGYVYVDGETADEVKCSPMKLTT